MIEHKVMRRLAAILAADIAGYSRLMGEDEAATVRDLKGHQAVVLPMIAEFDGRVIDTAGDGILAEFPSAVGALECAVEMQRLMAVRNQEVPEQRRMQFRVGINLGDVIHDEARIYGDGINVAARLENLAKPGAICISEELHLQVRDKLDLAYRDLGEKELKNIARAVRVFAVSVGAKQEASNMAKPTPVAGDIDLSLPDKPSIAVLPFTNISGDPGQEYFTDGVTEDIITELSRFRSLFVIARNSSFAYKSKAI